MSETNQYSPEYLNRLGHFNDCAVSVLADRQVLAAILCGSLKEFEGMNKEELMNCIGDVECRIIRIDPAEKGTSENERKRREIRFALRHPESEKQVHFILRYIGLNETETVPDEGMPEEYRTEPVRGYIIEIRSLPHEWAGENSDPEGTGPENQRVKDVKPAFDVLHLVLNEKMPADVKIRKLESCGVMLSPRSRVRLAEMEELMKEG